MAAFAYVQSIQSTSTGSLTFGSANTAGNLIVAVNSCFSETLATSVTDSQSNTYVQIGTQAFGNGSLRVFAAASIAGGASNIVTFNGASTGGGDNSFIIAEYTVPLTYAIGNPTGINNTTSTFIIPSADIIGSPTGAEVMIIPIIYDGNAFHTWTLSQGTIRETTHEPGNATLFLGDYDVVSPSGIQVTTATGSTGVWAICSLNLVAWSTGGGGGGGGIGFRSDWSGGFNG